MDEMLTDYTHMNDKRDVLFISPLHKLSSKISPWYITKAGLWNESSVMIYARLVFYKKAWIKSEWLRGKLKSGRAL